MPTATPVLADLLDAVVSRLGDIAADLRHNLSDPVLAEVRNAARAAERAYLLLSQWVPHPDDTCHDDIMAAIERHLELLIGIVPMPPDKHFASATIEAHDADGDAYVRVIMPGCVYLVRGELDETDGASAKTCWSVVGRYPQ